MTTGGGGSEGQSRRRLSVERRGPTRDVVVRILDFLYAMPVPWPQDLGVFNYLREGPRTVAVLAKLTKTPTEALIKV